MSDTSSERARPAGSTSWGPAVISLAVGVYGVTWLAASFVLFYGAIRPDPVAVFAPFVGLALLLVAVGLWERRWLAWAVAVAGLSVIFVWETLRANALSLGSVPVVPGVVVAYLVARRDLYT